MKSLLLIICLISCSCSFATELKTDSLKELFKINGLNRVINKVYDVRFTGYKRVFKDAKVDFWKEIESRHRVDMCLDKIAEVYKKYMSEEEAQAFLEYYKTAGGKYGLSNKSVKATPEEEEDIDKFKNSESYINYTTYQNKLLKETNAIIKNYKESINEDVLTSYKGQQVLDVKNP